MMYDPLIEKISSTEQEATCYALIKQGLTDFYEILLIGCQGTYEVLSYYNVEY
jgi:hypothetical protein